MKDTIKITIHLYNHYSIDIVDDVMKITNAAHTHKQVIIDTSTEPVDLKQIPWKGKTRLLDVLHTLCEQNNWPREKFHIISWNPLQETDTWPYMQTLWYSHHFTHVANKVLTVKKSIDKHFGIYVNNSSWPRLWLSAYLGQHHQNKTDQTFVRSTTNAGHMANLDLDALLFNFSSIGRMDNVDLAAIGNLIRRSPLTTSKIPLETDEDMHFSTRTDHDDIMSAVADDIMQRYNRIFCDVVCETMFTGSCITLSEKVARCFMTETPFVAMASKGFLSDLRTLGFKTFHDHWDESYDYTSDALRCIEISKVIDRLACLDLPGLKKLYDSLRHIVKHNKERYLELCGMQTGELEKMVVNSLRTKSQ